MKKITNFLVLSLLVSSNVLPPMVNAEVDGKSIDKEYKKLNTVESSSSFSSISNDIDTEDTTQAAPSESFLEEETTNSMTNEIETKSSIDANQSTLESDSVASMEPEKTKTAESTDLEENQPMAEEQTLSWGELTVRYSVAEGLLTIPGGSISDPKSIAELCKTNGITSIKKVNIERPLTIIGNAEYLFSELTHLIEIQGLNQLNTENVTDMSNMFYMCTSLRQLDLSNFNTTNVTNMSGMFKNCNELRSVNVSSFNTANVRWMVEMFRNCYNLERLDISGFYVNQNINNYDKMLYLCCPKQLVLGRNVYMNSIMNLSEIESNKNYTGKWQNVGTGSIEQPNGKNIWTSKELMDNYSGEKDADTYVWQPTVKAKDITVKYVDTEGTQLHEEQILSGNVGEEYDTTSSTYKLTIPGYTLDKSQFPENAKGIFSEEPQTVTYVYTKNPVKAKDITVKYVDTEGTQLHEEQILSGNVGEEYDTTSSTYKLTIPGYTLDKSQFPENAKGIFSEEPQTVTYVYTKNPVKAKDITVKYVDTEGTQLHEEQILSGNVGEEYDTTSLTYKLTIPGYTLDKSQFPENAKGIFSEEPQTVTYVYKNNKETNKQENENNNHQDNGTSSGRLLPSAGEKTALHSIAKILGGLLLLVVGSVIVYRKRNKK
ncbi:MucBP domain-containing protein [Enterococcus faecalis]|uniref:MucBP domain-containing protein n=1 Tax=Enterococcus faecalis TaxID=1351 RepID=UPI003D0E28D3